MRKKEFLFIILNITIVRLVLTFDFIEYIPLLPKQLLLNLLFYFILFLPSVLEFVISSTFSYIFRFNLTWAVATFSFICNFLIFLLGYSLSSFSDDFTYIFLFCFTQIAGIKFGNLLRERQSDN